MTLQLGRCQSVFSLSVLFVRKHLFCNALSLAIFCALALLDCACGMDHESVTDE